MPFLKSPAIFSDKVLTMQQTPDSSIPQAAVAYLSTIEVAQLLGLAVRSVQLMVDRGELQAWRTSGGHRRISRDSVTQWLSSRQDQTSVRADPGTRDSLERPYQVLLIEDSAHFQNLVALLIEQHFPQSVLHMASDGISGLTKFGQIQPDCLLVDILLSGIDGAALVTTLKSDPQFARCQLMIVTGLTPTQLAPYQFALEGLPIIHKSQIVNELVPLMAKTMPQLAHVPG